jgi:hypothetical protein
MAEIVTPVQMARVLQISAKTLRAWLRGGRDGGHPLLSGHEHDGRWEFTRADADNLIAEYRRTHGHGSPRSSGSTSRSVRPRRTPAAGHAVPASKAPLLPGAFTRPALTTAGFEGWLTWPKIRKAGYADIPSLPGVYVIVRMGAAPPAFVHPGTGGRFKGEDSSVPQARLEAEWVDGARVLNIGKADARKAGGVNDGLRGRLREYGRFGAGEPVGHRGGRLIWQLADADKLLVAWHVVTWDETARDYERRLLARFAELHDGHRPFANLTG